MATSQAPDTMPRFRFSLRALAAFVSFVAVGYAALLYASPWVASTAFW